MARIADLINSGNLGSVKLNEILDIFNKKYSDLNSYEKFFIKKRLLIFQDWKCAICDKEINDFKEANLDHNHDSDRIRGVLCMICNHGLGCFKDKQEYLISAIKYLSTRYIAYDTTECG